jgi:DNA-binding transcriptional ArsR family regulator
MNADSLFQTLADPSRRRLMALLLRGERSAGELVEIMAMSQPAVSKHLKLLREAGFAEVRIDGQRRLYSLRPEPLAELDAWLAPFRIFWSRKLDSLERYLDMTPAHEEP